MRCDKQLPNIARIRIDTKRHKKNATNRFLQYFIAMKTSAETLNILLVEDDPIIAMDAAMEIEDWGHECHVAYDLDTAMEMLTEIPFDAALLDYDLGDHTSLPIAIELSDREMPFAFVTGRDVGEISRKLGIEPIVFTKPVDYAVVAKNLLDADPSPPAALSA